MFTASCAFYSVKHFSFICEQHAFQNKTQFICFCDHIGKIYNLLLDVDFVDA